MWNGWRREWTREEFDVPAGALNPGDSHYRLALPCVLTMLFKTDLVAAMKKILLFICLSCVSAHGQKFDNLAQTPPMGWNSWNKFGKDVNEELIRQTADAMVSSGMKAAGYEYINIDDTWQGERDRQGFIQADPRKFPSGIKALAGYVHSKGLKLGIYSDGGAKTCGGYAGSRGHEYQDAQMYAQWDVDYLKYDWCGCEDLNAQGGLHHHAGRVVRGRPADGFQHLRMGQQQALGMGRSCRQSVAHHRRYSCLF